MNKAVVGGRIIKFLLLLQEFDITIVDKPGKDNVVVDFLSRLNVQGNNEPVDDVFPDEDLFAISIQSLWFANLANYLVLGKCPQHFNSKQIRRLVRESSRYKWVNGLLFKNCLDHVLCWCE